MELEWDSPLPVARKQGGRWQNPGETAIRDGDRAVPKPENVPKRTDSCRNEHVSYIAPPASMARQRRSARLVPRQHHSRLRIL